MSSLRAILCGGAPVPRSLIEALRGQGRERADRAGLGDDRDEPDRRRGDPSGRRPCRRRDRVPRQRPAGFVSVSRSVSWTPTARYARRTAKSVGEFEIRGPWITARVLRRGRPREASTTAGCAPGTSGRSTPRASCRSPTAPRTSSSRGASGSPRSSSRTSDGPPRSLRGGGGRRWPMTGGRSGRCACVVVRPTAPRRPPGSSRRSSRAACPRGGSPSAGLSSTRCQRGCRQVRQEVSAGPVRQGRARIVDHRAARRETRGLETRGRRDLDHPSSSSTGVGKAGRPALRPIAAPSFTDREAVQGRPGLAARIAERPKCSRARLHRSPSGRTDPAELTTAMGERTLTGSLGRPAS